MIFSLYHFLAALAVAKASPMPQAPATADGALPALPSSSIKPSPLPLGNAAIWQEAVGIDATIDVGKNYLVERFYQLIAYGQSCENASNSIAFKDPITAASMTSQGLQELHIYPTQFNQPQAANPATTKSK